MCRVIIPLISVYLILSTGMITRSAGNADSQHCLFLVEYINCSFKIGISHSQS